MRAARLALLLKFSTCITFCCCQKSAKRWKKKSLGRKNALQFLRKSFKKFAFFPDDKSEYTVMALETTS